jgi:hypothetical protein
MSNNNTYFALNRRAFERIADLTWNQFFEKHGRNNFDWGDGIGATLSICLNIERGIESAEPKPEEKARILKWTIRKTFAHKGSSYFDFYYLAEQMKRQDFLKVDVEAEHLEDDCDAVVICAISDFLFGIIDGRTFWSVLAIHEQWVPEILRSWQNRLNKTERKRIRALMKRFGRCRPIFDWQRLHAVGGGYGALREEDTKRFSRFIQQAWRRNPEVYFNGERVMHFRDFWLSRRLHAASRAMVGNCLIYYWGA